MANIYALTHRHARARARAQHSHTSTHRRPSARLGRTRPSRLALRGPSPQAPVPNRSRLHGAEAQSCPRATSSYCLLPNLSTHAHARMSIENAVWVEACPPAQAHVVLCNVQHRSHDRRVRCCCSPPAHLGSVVHASRPLDALVIYRFGEVTRCELSETVRMPSHFPTSLRNAACTRRGRWLRSHTATLPRFMYRTLCAGTWLLFYFKGILRAKKII